MFERRFGRHALIALIITVIVTLIIFQVFRGPFYRLFSDFLSPYLRAPAFVESSVITASDYAKPRSTLIEEKNLLLAELNELRSMRSELQILREDYDALRKLCNLPELPRYTYVHAQVVLRDPAAWGQTLIINRGSDDGITPGAPVLSVSLQRSGEQAAYRLVVVGRISDDISRNTAAVQTILNKECRLSAFLPASESAGVITGGYEAGDDVILNLRNLPLSRMPKDGETVYTSGLSGYTPRGLLIGHIISNTQGASAAQRDYLYAEALVKSAADIHALRYVIIPVQKQKTPTP